MRFCALITALLVSVAAHAAPASSTAQQPDDLDRLLADKGLLQQLEQVRQNVREHMSNLVVHAIGFLGVPYKRGGNSVESGGLDCSGFVRAVYEQISGLVLPRRAEQQAAATQPIPKAELQPGDLVFFNTMRHAFSHVGIYIGDGKFVHSPKPGAEVRIEDMALSYWNRRFDGARRVAAPTAPEQQQPAPAQPAAAQPALMLKTSHSATFQ